jgi:hypothetical protein
VLSRLQLTAFVDQLVMCDGELRLGSRQLILSLGEVVLGAASTGSANRVRDDYGRDSHGRRGEADQNFDAQVGLDVARTASAAMIPPPPGKQQIGSAEAPVAGGGLANQ